MLRAEHFEKAKRATEKAIALDDQLAEAHMALADINRAYFWDWKKARTEYDKAKSLNQQFSGATYFINVVFGKNKEALQDALSSLTIDPLNPINWSNAGTAYRYLGDPANAIKYFKKELEIRPFAQDAHISMAEALAELGKPDLAIEELKKVQDQDFAPVLSMSAKTYWIKGDKRKSDYFLNRLLNEDNHPIDNSVHIAYVYVDRGDKDEAMKWFNIGFDRRHPGLSFLYNQATRTIAPTSMSVGFLALREDARFKELLRKMNLPDRYPD